MTEREVQLMLFRELASSHCPLIPNYTPACWFECDVFSVTKAGYFHEHEIKLSVGDFCKDGGKRGRSGYRRNADGGLDRVPAESKHERLARADEKGPSCFWFVCGESVAAKVQVPDWAGLKVLKIGRNKLSIVKAAPRLHCAKVGEKIEKHAFSVCYWRFWKERMALERLKTLNKVKL